MRLADFEILAEQVRTFQKKSPDMRKRWTEFCGRYAQGVKDQYKHDKDSLALFLDLHSLTCGICGEYNPGDCNYCGGCGSRLSR